MTLRCPTCGREFGPLDALCTECGTELERIAPAPEAEATMTPASVTQPQAIASPEVKQPSGRPVATAPEPTTVVPVMPPASEQHQATAGSMLFSYTARQRNGQVVTGDVWAANEDDARDRIRQLGLLITTLRPRRSARPAGDSMLRAVYSGVPLRAMAFFFRQLAMLVKSGMSSAEALGVLEGQTGNGRLRLATRQAAAHCRTGGRISDIFQRYPHMFGEPVIEMIKAGEEGGALERFLERVADYLERQYDVSSRIKGALAYPLFMIFALIFIPNVPIWVTSGPAAYFSSTLLWAGSLVGICLSAFVALRLVLANPSSARLCDQIKLSLPLIGKVVRQFAIGRFGRTLAMLYSAGVNIPHAIEISARASGNSYLAERLATAAGPVRAGGSLVDAIAKTNCMPVLALHVMSTGEKTGNMDLMVTKLAEFSEADANTAVDQAVALILPICVIILGGVVLVMVAKFYTGYFANIFKEAGS